MKSIVKVVHLPLVVQSEFSEATRMLFVCKEYENNEPRLVFSTNRLFSVSPHQRSTILDIDPSNASSVRSSVSASMQRAYTACVQCVISKMAIFFPKSLFLFSLSTKGILTAS